MGRLLMLTSLAVLCVAVLSCDRKTGHKEVSFEGERLVLPVDGLGAGVPRFYSVSLEDRRIRFFLIKVNGEIASYFDACLSCYQKEKGFREESGYVICNACRIKYPVESLKTGIGGCYPIRLQGSLEEGRFVVMKDALRAGLKYF